MRYVLDTNVIIDLLNLTPSTLQHLDKAQKSNNKIVIPSIVNYEIKRGFYYKPALKKQKGYDYISKNFMLLDIDEKAWDCAALTWSQLRKQGITIGEVDLLIAAQCLAHNYTLVTANTKHFEIIDGLAVVDWTV